MSNQPYSPDPRMQNDVSPSDQTVYERPAPAAMNDTVEASQVGAAYSQRQHERYVDAAGNRIESQAEVFEDKNQSRANTRYWIATVTYFVLAVLEVILLLRFFFRLFGANPYNSFISFLYNLSGPFVAPFRGIFNEPAIGQASHFEVSTLIAMIIYALLAWGIVSLGRVIFAPNLSGRQRVTTTRRSF